MLSWRGDGTTLLAVVDDDAGVRVALTRLVSSAGFAVETFASGAEFLRSVEDHEPDCLLLDLHMPEMTGFELQGAPAVAHAALPVVVITGHDTTDSRTRARRSIVDGDRHRNRWCIGPNFGGVRVI